MNGKEDVRVQNPKIAGPGSAQSEFCYLNSAI